MAPLAIDLDKVLPATDVVDEISFGIEVAAELVGVGDFEFSADLNDATIGSELAE